LLRKLEFELVYPPFINFECFIVVSGLPQGEKKNIFQIEKSTTLEDVVTYARKMTEYFGADFEINDGKGKNFSR
jgi:hypothetical protein